jgi:hypothetical protein
VRKPKEPTAEERAQYAHDLAEARAALEGCIQPPLDAVTVKTACALFDTNCDAVISNQGFLVQFRSGRRIIAYYSFIAPTLLGHLLRWAGAKTPCAELRAVPVRADAPKLRLAPELRTDGNHLLWLRDAGEVIRFALRRDSEELRGLAWPPPVTPYKPPVPRYLELDPTRPCPHCGEALSRVRDLSDGMICQQCGRSFTSWDPLNPNPRRY